MKFLNDEPIKEIGEDLLGRKEFIENLVAQILKIKQREWIVLGIHGDWGSGKSHLQMLFKERAGRDGIALIQDCIDGRAGSLAHIHRCVPRWL
ncbi:MAG: BREX system ATP-binding domain-containing protein, partial [Candidatus Hodarchaeota archaeon]